jgi:hypothetical protein
MVEEEYRAVFKSSWQHYLAISIISISFVAILLLPFLLRLSVPEWQTLGAWSTYTYMIITLATLIAIIIASLVAVRQLRLTTQWRAAPSLDGL